METTTIRVHVAARDRLARQAADAGMSMAEYLDHLSEQHTTAEERAERAQHNRRALAETFGIQLTDDDVAAADAFVRGLPHSAT